MSLADYSVILIVVIWIVVSVIYMVRRRKKGRCIGCGGNCESCVYKNNKNNKQ